MKVRMNTKPVLSDLSATRAGRSAALVVDDDRLFAAHCGALLREQGFEVEVAHSGAEALALLEEEPFALVVCDLIMPGTDGATVLERAARSAARPAVIMVTAVGEATPALEPVRAANWPIIFKPLEPVEFTKMIAWLMHARHVANDALSRSELDALYRMATAANMESSSEAVLDRVLRLCLGALGGDSGSVMLATPGAAAGRALTIATSVGIPHDPLRGPLKFGEGIAGWVAQEQRPLRLVGPLSAYPQFRALQSRPSVGDALIAPIVFRREVLGTMSINATREGIFGPEKLAVLVSATEILAAALHRSRLEQHREHQDRLALLGQLSASVAHELNNPLSYLKASLTTLSGMLLESSSPLSSETVFQEEIGSVLADAQDAMERILTLVSNQRTASRKPVQQRQDVDVTGLLRRAESLVHPRYKHRVRLLVEPASTATVLGDAGRLLQILLNLLVNAEQAVERDGQVILRSRCEPGWIVIEVEDNGPGIPEEVAHHLFEAFFTTKGEGEGTGLGLSISRQIAREHGGELGFVSVVGKGTCFQLRLPAAGTAATTPARPCVLLVDDEPALLRAAERVLGEAFEVIAAATPEEALSKSQGREGTIDLVLSDFLMPGRDGLELVRELRARCYSGPAALVTAVHEEPRLQAAVRSRLVQQVIEKPWSPTALLSQARQLVSGEARSGARVGIPSRGPAR